MGGWKHKIILGQIRNVQGSKTTDTAFYRENGSLCCTTMFLNLSHFQDAWIQFPEFPCRLGIKNQVAEIQKDCSSSRSACSNSQRKGSPQITSFKHGSLQDPLFYAQFSRRPLPHTVTSGEQGGNVFSPLLRSWNTRMCDLLNTNYAISVVSRKHFETALLQAWNDFLRN